MILRVFSVAGSRLSGSQEAIFLTVTGLSDNDLRPSVHSGEHSRVYEV